MVPPGRQKRWRPCRSETAAQSRLVTGVAAQFRRDRLRERLEARAQGGLPLAAQLAGFQPAGIQVVQRPFGQAVSHERNLARELGGRPRRAPAIESQHRGHHEQRHAGRRSSASACAAPPTPCGRPRRVPRPCGRVRRFPGCRAHPGRRSPCAARAARSSARASAPGVREQQRFAVAGLHAPARARRRPPAGAPAPRAPRCCGRRTSGLSSACAMRCLSPPAPGRPRRPGHRPGRRARAPVADELVQAALDVQGHGLRLHAVFAHAREGPLKAERQQREEHVLHPQADVAPGRAART